MLRHSSTLKQISLQVFFYLYYSTTEKTTSIALSSIASLSPNDVCADLRKFTSKASTYHVTWHLHAKPLISHKSITKSYVKTLAHSFFKKFHDASETFIAPRNLHDLLRNLDYTIRFEEENNVPRELISYILSRFCCFCRKEQLKCLSVYYCFSLISTPSIFYMQCTLISYIHT